MADLDWATEPNPAELLRAARGRVSHRKLRLLAVACCRRVRAMLGKGAPGRHQIGMAEAYADAKIGKDTFASAFPAGGPQQAGDRSPAAVFRLAAYALGWWDAEEPNWDWDEAAGDLVRRPWEPGEYAEHFTMRVLLHASHAAARLEGEFRIGYDRESAAQADLIRDIIPDPSRPVAFAADWRTDTAVALARRVYDGRDFALLPVLADALDDAGCDHPDLLAHCRGPGPHARGCWVVDEVLGLS